MIDIKKFSFLYSGKERSVKAKKNIVALVFLKGISIMVSFMLVPIILNYLSSEKYGIWLTLSSVFSWISFFDIGLGNGLKNRYIEANAKGEKEKIRVYVSTAYAALSVIITAVLLIFIAVNPFLNWPKILNSYIVTGSELSLLALIVFAFFCVRFVVSLINTLLTADQRPAAANMLDVISNLLSLVIIYFLMKYTDGSLLYLGLAIGLSMTLVPVLASVWYYNRDYRYCSPAVKYIRLKSVKDLMDIGIQFFILQTAFIVVFATNNIIIAQLFGPNEVTSYNIVFKYFSVITMAFNIIITPFWSAYGDAYHRGDTEWINKVTRYLIKIWAASIAAAIVMLVVAKQAYFFWLRQEIEVAAGVSAVMAAYVIISNWNSIFASFLNGTGKIRLQLYLALIITIVNIPLAIALAKWAGLGIAGVILASCISLLAGSVLAPIQYLKIVKGSARGIWSK